MFSPVWVVAADRCKVDYVYLHGIADGFDIGFPSQPPLTSARKNKASPYEHPARGRRCVLT